MNFTIFKKKTKQQQQQQQQKQKQNEAKTITLVLFYMRGCHHQNTTQTRRVVIV